MAKDFAKTFYKSAAWQKCRVSYIAKRIAIDGGLCEECQEQLGYIVHHKILLTPDNITDSEVALNWDNLEYLCQDCHNREHMSKHSPLREDVMFDENGDLIRSDSDWIMIY